MSNLAQLTEQHVTELFKRVGSFYAFSEKQFEESKKPGVEYHNLGGGLIAPKGTEKELYEELDKIYRKGRADDIALNGKKKIIIRELYNYECFYTLNCEMAVITLKDYGFSEEDIAEVFSEELNKNH